MREHRAGAAVGALCWGLASISAVMPAGCGAPASGDYVVVSPGQTVLPAPESAWQPPEALVADLRACVKEHAGDLKTYSHHTKFDVTVTEEGAVERVDLRSSTLHHSALESCIAGVLATLSLPASELPLRTSEPVSGGERMRSEGQPLGVVQVIAGVALGPIIIVAAGVTLGVAIVVAATEEAIEAAKRKRRRIEDMCMERLVECVADPWQPKWNQEIFGDKKQCEACVALCKARGSWPEDKCPRSN